MPRPRDPIQLRHPPESATREEKIAFYQAEIQRLDSFDEVQFNHQLTRNQHIDTTQGDFFARPDLYLASRERRHLVAELKGRAEYEIYKLENADSDEEGGGVRSVLTSILHGGRRTAPPSVRNVLADNQGAKVVKIQAAVVPVQKHLHSFLNWVSGGEYEKKRQSLGYNDINHAYLLVTLDNGKTYRLEKNHVVEIYNVRPNSDNHQKFDIQLSGQPTLDSLLDHAEKYQESTKQGKKSRGNFWQYDPQNNNCQYFVDDIVQGNPEITNKREANEFFFQPGAGDLIDTTGRWKPHVRWVVPAVTIADRLIHGEGAGPALRKQQHIRLLLKDRSHPYH